MCENQDAWKPASLDLLRAFNPEDSDQFLEFQPEIRFRSGRLRYMHRYRHHSRHLVVGLARAAQTVRTARDLL